MENAERFTSLRTFYPYYLSEHRNVNCRRLHFAGSTLVLVVVAVAIVTRNPYWLFAALFCGYGFAWVGHFFFEHNRPATFKYPLYSFVSDWIMYAQILTGKVKV
jgi:hypothetical protein